MNDTVLVAVCGLAVLAFAAYSLATRTTDESDAPDSENDNVSELLLPAPPLATCARFLSPVEALSALSLLQGNQIPSVLFDAHLTQINDLYSFAIGGIRLQVSEHDLDRAVAVLDEYGSFQRRSAMSTELVCDECGSPALADDEECVYCGASFDDRPDGA